MGKNTMREVRRFPCRVLILLTVATLAILSSRSESLAQLVQEPREVQALTPSLVAPIPSQGFSTPQRRDPVSVDVVRSRGESANLLVSAPPYAELVVGAQRTSFGTPILLPIKAYQVKSAEGKDGEFWIGGVRDGVVSIDSVRQSHGYLAKLDRSGKLLWERDYGEETERSIQSLAPLASGDVVVSGQDSHRTWLARISSEGEVVWERFIGLGKGSAVTAQNGFISLAALDSCQCDGGYREDVAVWLFDQAGKPMDRQTIRQGINVSSSYSAAQIDIEKTEDSIYVFSVWAAYQPKPLEVTKLSSKREILWSKSLPESVWRQGNLSGAYLPPHGLLLNGDVLLATREQIGSTDFLLSRLDAADGKSSETVVRMPNAPPPECIQIWGLAHFLREEPDGKALLLGSPPAGRGGRSCGWIGEVALPKALR